jgi:hypothetical protein
MAPLPYNNTGRIALQYTANTKVHVVTFRYPGAGAPDDTDLESIDEVLIALNAFMPASWTFDAWSYTVAHDNVGVPIDGNPTTFAGAGADEAFKDPAYLSVVGRTVGGHRARFTMIGANFAANSSTAASNYRVSEAENTAVADLLTAVRGSAILGIDGDVPRWKSYVNLGFSSYWTKQVRS